MSPAHCSGGFSLIVLTICASRGLAPHAGAPPSILRYYTKKAILWMTIQLGSLRWRSCTDPRVRLCYSVPGRIRGASGMAKSTTMTVRLKPEVSERLEMLARGTKRSKAYLASEAIEAYVELNSWQVAHIKRALEEDESSVPGVPHEEVVSWMESWGTDRELPPPEPKGS